MMVFRVKSSTNVNKLAGALFTNIKNTDSLVMSCLGAGSLNQAIKAFITAKGIASPMGIDLKMDPYFATTSVDDNEKTVIEIKVYKEMKEE